MLKCDNYWVAVRREPGERETSMFIEVENSMCWTIVYHEKTKVMYAVTDGFNGRGSFNVLLNPDGTPMLWEG